MKPRLKSISVYLRNDFINDLCDFIGCLIFTVISGMLLALFAFGIIALFRSLPIIFEALTQMAKSG